MEIPYDNDARLNYGMDYTTDIDNILEQVDGDIDEVREELQEQILTEDPETGELVGIEITEDGYLDLWGLRETIELDFSQFDSGLFTETVQGESDLYSYRVDFDTDGRPTKIYDDEHELTIIWDSSETEEEGDA